MMSYQEQIRTFGSFPGSYLLRVVKAQLFSNYNVPKIRVRVRLSG